MTAREIATNVLHAIPAVDLSDRDALTVIIDSLAIMPSDKTPNAVVSLLDKFGSLRNVMEARPEALSSVISRTAAEKLAALLPIIRLYTSRQDETPRTIRDRSDLERCCKSLLQGERTESFWVICVNAQCQVLGARRIATGSLSEVSTYPRLVLETALNYNAHSVFFSHNHPGGTCRPSQEDIASTLQLQRALNAVDILVLDHMIIAGDKAYSMAQNGDFEFGARARR